MLCCALYGGVLYVVFYGVPYSVLFVVVWFVVI